MLSSLPSWVMFGIIALCVFGLLALVISMLRSMAAPPSGIRTRAYTPPSATADLPLAGDEQAARGRASVGTIVRQIEERGAAQGRRSVRDLLDLDEYYEEPPR